MDRIKSFEELTRIRDRVKNRIEVRETGEKREKTIVAVGMATCGIAAGARQVFKTILEEIRAMGLEDIAVLQTGCMGYCYAEPIVEIRVPGEPSILYGDVDENRAKAIVQIHLKEGRLLNEAIIGKGFEKI